MSISGESEITTPSISSTSPLETNVRMIFFPMVEKAGFLRSANFAKTADATRVKSKTRQIDLGNFFTDQFVSNKANPDYNDHNEHVTTTRNSQERQNRAHAAEHDSKVSGIMFGKKTNIKKGNKTVSSGGTTQNGPQSFSGMKTARDTRSSGIKQQSDKSNGAVYHLTSSKLALRETLLTPSVNGKEGSKKKTIKPSEVKLEPYLLPRVDHSPRAPLRISVIPSREGHARRISPRFSFEKVNEESSTRAIRTGMDHSPRKPKYLGTKVSSGAKDRSKSPGKFSPPNVSTARKKIDKPGGHCLEDGMDDMVLPKVTINEVLQSWNINPQKTRSVSHLVGKDPMEFLLKDRSLSDPKNPPISYEELRGCRYLRTDKDDQALHGKLCSCNSCEHGEGLKKSPYLNS